jgi:hypothetical protein
MLKVRIRFTLATPSTSSDCFLIVLSTYLIMCPRTRNEGAQSKTPYFNAKQEKLSVATFRTSSPTPKKPNHGDEMEEAHYITTPHEDDQYQNSLQVDSFRCSPKLSIEDGHHAAMPPVSSFCCSPTLLVRETPPKIRQPSIQVPDSQVGWYELFPTTKPSTHSKRTIDDSSRPCETSMSSSCHGEDRDDDDTSFQSSAPVKEKPRKFEKRLLLFPLSHTANPSTCVEKPPNCNSEYESNPAIGQNSDHKITFRASRFEASHSINSSRAKSSPISQMRCGVAKFSSEDHADGRTSQNSPQAQHNSWPRGLELL